MGIHQRLPITLRRYHISNRGVIHVGAHEGQEFAHYERCGIKRQVWVEPQPDVFSRLKTNLPTRPDVHALNFACGATAGRAQMHVLAGNEGQSNSLLEPKEHLRVFSEFQKSGTIEVDVVPLDDLLERNGLAPSDFSLLSMDTQGFELEVLKGAPRVVAAVDAVVTEITEIELYAGCPRVRDLDAFLGDAGFRRVISRIGKQQFGDAMYVRATLLTGWQRRRLRWFGAARR
jgi:FkbM family methyltransferase